MPEQSVAGCMAEGVVDILELVQIDEQQGMHLAARFNRIELLIEQLGEQMPVHQLRQRVVIGKLPELAVTLVQGRYGRIQRIGDGDDLLVAGCLYVCARPSLGKLAQGLLKVR